MQTNVYNFANCEAFGDRKSQKSWYLEELKKSAGYMYSKLKYEKLRGRKMTIELTQKKCQINC